MARSSGRKELRTTLERIMSRPVAVVHAGTTLAEAARRMLAANVGSLLVVNDADELIGVITESHFCARRAGIPFSTLHRPQVLGEWLGEWGVERVYREARRRTVGEVMTPRLYSVTLDESVETLLRMIMEHGITHVPVVVEKKPVGVVARHDLLKLLLEGISEDTPGKVEIC